MRINENFTADMIRNLREENVRLKKLDELKLTEEEKDVINCICSDIFKWASSTNDTIRVYPSLNHHTITYTLPTNNVNRDNISEWFKLQGFVPSSFMLKENEICILVP